VKQSLATRLALGLIRAYRIVLSPLFGQNCRFHPTCSAYALEAFEQHGFWRGLSLTLRRIGRCHPWHPGGIDEVPAPGDGRRLPGRI
jgi:putative membrane protein insertion efficiency factor